MSKSLLLTIAGIGETTVSVLGTLGIYDIYDLAKAEETENIKLKWVDDAIDIIVNQAHEQAIEFAVDLVEDGNNPELFKKSIDRLHGINKELTLEGLKNQLSDISVSSETLEIVQAFIESIDFDAVNTNKPPVSLGFSIESGRLRGQAVKWTENQPALTLGSGGIYIHLSDVSIKAKDEQGDKGIVSFVISIKGESGSGAIDSSEFKAFNEAIKKKQ